jgi:hypothetical protein
LPGDVSVSVPHAYVQWHSAATTGKHRFAAGASAVCTLATGAALVVALGLGALAWGSSRVHETRTSHETKPMTPSACLTEA